MSEEKATPAPKAKKYQLAKGHTLELVGFQYPITNELLQGPRADIHIRAIQNFETERGVKVLGVSIVLK